MICLIVVHIIFIIVFVRVAKVKERKKYVKLLSFFYKLLKGLDILLLSLLLYEMNDLSTVFPIIPINNVSINLTLYTLVITTVVNALEELLVNNKRVSIEASISPQKMGNTYIKDNIELPSIPGEWVTVFIILQIKGNIKSLSKSEILIKLPKTATAQVTKYFTSEDALKFPLNEFVSKDGLTSIEITLTKESVPVVSETDLEIELVTNSLIKEVFLIDISSEKCGMKEK